MIRRNSIGSKITFFLLCIHFLFPAKIYAPDQEPRCKPEDLAALAQPEIQPVDVVYVNQNARQWRVARQEKEKDQTKFLFSLPGYPVIELKVTPNPNAPKSKKPTDQLPPATQHLDTTGGVKRSTVAAMTLMMVAGLALLFPWVDKARDKADKMKCADDMRKISQALEQHELDFPKPMNKRSRELLEDPEVRSEFDKLRGTFTCPTNPPALPGKLPPPILDLNPPKNEKEQGKEEDGLHFVFPPTSPDQKKGTELLFPPEKKKK